ncbi:phosphatase PAP2 family protein [Paenarthrobacter ilicis]|uniref:phosphatase PAP2 family protein n=1 Tax=Paenarthrobacter ilicis TaxID=43665 RepID=UPI003864C62F
MIRVMAPQHRPGWQFLAPALVLLAAFVVPAVLLLAGRGAPAFQSVDTAWQSVALGWHTPFWDGVNAVLNLAGYTGALIVHAVLAVALLMRRRPKTAVFVLASGLSVLALTQLAKTVVGRERPQGAHVLTDTGSYPSGHVSATTALLAVVALLMARWWMNLVAVAGVLAMMLSRTYLSAHWLSDVFGGACLAGGVVFLLWWRFRDICIKENALPGQ